MHSLFYRWLVECDHVKRDPEAMRLASARGAPRLWLHALICRAGALLLYW
jgi:hypothetical protein